MFYREDFGAKGWNVIHKNSDRFYFYSRNSVRMIEKHQK